MKINETALVLIDMQKEDQFDLVDVKGTLRNAQKLLTEVRNKNIPVIYTRQINRADGVGLSKGEPLNSDGTPVYYLAGSSRAEVMEEIKPKDGDIIIDKHRWSAFYETNLELILKSLGVKHLIIGGWVTDGCLMTSVFDAYFRDYEIHLIKDICTTTSEGAHMASLLIMANWVYTMKVYDTDEFVKRLKGEDYECWEAGEIDEVKFAPDQLSEIFQKL